MTTKSKAPSKSAKGAKKSAKPAAKPAKTAKPAARKAPPKAAGKAKPAKKAAATKSAKPAVKVAPKAKAAATGKTAPNKAAPRVPARSAPRVTARSAPVASGAAASVPSAPSVATLPPPKPAVRPGQAVSAEELATAHEYLLSRSAGRSEAPIMVEGRPLLTEEQLLSMSEGQYMNAEQLAFFRYRLQQMEHELLSNADETTEHLRETVIVPDPADRATIEEEHALELRTRDRERKLLKKVQASLQQIEAGEYGFCEETGDPIGIPRLLARPTATLSLEAQQRREIKQKMFGD